MSCCYKKIQSLMITNESKNIISNDDIYNIKARSLFDLSIKKVIKRKNDDLPKEIDRDKNHIEYKSITSTTFYNVRNNIYRNINKNIPKDIDNLNKKIVIFIKQNIEKYFSFIKQRKF